MKNRKLKIQLVSKLVLVAITSALLIVSVFGWYATNTKATASGGMGSTAISETMDFNVEIDGTSTSKTSMVPNSVITLRYPNGIEASKSYTITLTLEISMPTDYSEYAEYTKNTGAYYYDELDPLGNVKKFTGDTQSIFENFATPVAEALVGFVEGSSVENPYDTVMDTLEASPGNAISFSEQDGKYVFSKNVVASSDEITIMLYFKPDVYTTYDGITMKNSNGFIGQSVKANIQIMG